jgi:hypothetical protein
MTFRELVTSLPPVPLIGVILSLVSVLLAANDNLLDPDDLQFREGSLALPTARFSDIRDTCARRIWSK